MMKIVAGLGNPSFRYRNTKHNIGFRVLEAFAKRYGCRINKRAFKGVYGMARVAGEEVMLLKPLTYVNLSGEAVEMACSSRLTGKEELLVVSDDFNLPMGYLRLREKGSAGGHNGLKSIIEEIGEEFTRLRVGIGSEDMPDEKSTYVLSPFSREERPVMEEAIQRSVDCVEIWIEKGIGEAAGFLKRNGEL